MGRSAVTPAALAGIVLAVAAGGAVPASGAQQRPAVGGSADERPAAAGAPPGRVKAHRDLAYAEEGLARQKLDLYLPDRVEEAAGTGSGATPLPLIIWVHGGGWQAGDKGQCLPLRQGFVERGYAVASVGYRLSGDAPFPAQIQDVKAAVRWLRAHAKEYNLDPGRIGAWGSSAGGHLVALLGASGGAEEFDRSGKGAISGAASRVQAVCDFYGPTDLVRMAQTPGYERHARADAAEGRLLGGPVLENRDKAARASPITYIDQGDPPFLIVHGDRDPVVPLDQSRALFDALKKAGVRVRLHTLRGAGHGGPGFSSPEITQMVGAFFDRALKGKTAAPAAPASEQPEARVTESDAGGAGAPEVRRRLPSWEDVLARGDADRDARLSRTEFRGPPQLFERLDRDGDGLLTRQEYEAASGRPPAPGGAPPPAPAGAASPATLLPPGGSRVQAGDPAESEASVPAGFRLDGERWTYRDGDVAVSGILLKPEGRGPFPAILISHGMGGSAESFGRDKAREMVRWGYVCIAPDYTHSSRELAVRRTGVRRTARAGAGTTDGARAPDGASAPGAARPPGAGAAAGSPDRRPPGSPSDYGASAENLRRARACIDILRGLPEVDGSRLLAYGHSMGGFVTIGLAAVEPGLLRAAAVTGSGVSARAGYPAPAAEAARKIRAPFLILHGGADPAVRPEQSASLKAALDASGVAGERHVFEGDGHGIDRTRRQEVLRRVREWFDRHGSKSTNDATNDPKR